MLSIKVRRAAAVIAALAAVFWCAAFMRVPVYANAAYKALLVDLDNCIPAADEAELTKYIQRAADKIECNIGVVITAELNGKTDVQYSESFLNDNFGRGSSSVVLMLLNTYDNPAYARYTDQISLDGRGNDYYESRANKIFDSVYDGLDSSGFEQSVRDFCDALVRYKGSSGSTGMSESLELYFDKIMGALFIPMIIGLILAFTITNNIAKKYTKKTPISAVNYLDKNRTALTRKNDIFVREYTRTYTSSSSGGSRGRGHSGGGGGSHRSGGHSSHGGRHR